MSVPVAGIFTRYTEVGWPASSGGFFVATMDYAFRSSTDHFWLEVTRLATSDGSMTRIYQQASTLNGSGDDAVMFCTGVARIDDVIYVSYYDAVSYDTTYSLAHGYTFAIVAMDPEGTVLGTSTFATDIDISSATTQVPRAIHAGQEYVDGAIAKRLYVTTFPANVTSGGSASLSVLDADLNSVTPVAGLGATYSSKPRELTPVLSMDGIHAHHEAPEGNGVRYIYHTGDFVSGSANFEAVQGTAGFTELSIDEEAGDNRPVVHPGQYAQVVCMNVGGGLATAFDAVTGSQILEDDEVTPVEYGGLAGDGRFGVRVTGANTAEVYYAGDDPLSGGTVERYDDGTQVWSKTLVPSEGDGLYLSEVYCHGVVPSGD